MHCICTVSTFGTLHLQSNVHCRRASGKTLDAVVKLLHRPDCIVGSHAKARLLQQYAAALVQVCQPACCFTGFCIELRQACAVLAPEHSYAADVGKAAA